MTFERPEVRLELSERRGDEKRKKRQSQTTHDREDEETEKQKGRKHKRRKTKKRSDLGHKESNNMHGILR